MEKEWILLCTELVLQLAIGSTERYPYQQIESDTLILGSKYYKTTQAGLKIHKTLPDLRNSHFTEDPARQNFSQDGIEYGLIKNMFIQWSPVEMQTTRHRNMICSSITVPTPVLLHNVILPPHSFQCARLKNVTEFCSLIFFLNCRACLNYRDL